MKKVLVTMLALVMTLALFTACGEKEETSSTVTDYTFEFGETVPAYTLEGEWEAVDTAEPEDYTIEGIYKYTGDVADTDGVLLVGAYSWDKSTDTLYDEALESVKEDWGEYAEDVEIVESDNWETEGDYHYAHYTAFDEETCGDPTYFSAYIFEAGDKMYEYDFWVKTEKVTIGEYGMCYYLPYGFKEIPCDNEYENEYVKGYESLNEELAGVEFYQWEEDTSFEEVTKRNENNDKYETLESEYYTYPINGKDVDCFYCKYREKTDTDNYIVAEYLCKIDGVFYCEDFYQIDDGTEYQLSSHSAMINGITNAD